MTAQAEIYRHLRDFAEHFVPPAPFSSRFEISDGTIVMMSPGGNHDLAAFRLQGQLPDGIIATTSGDVEEASLGQLRRPDVLVLPEAAMATDDAIPPSALLLAVEIVSPSNPQNDYESKLRHYPILGIPHYVIIDPRDGTAHHYWSIIQRDGRSVYDDHVSYTFGDTIPVGDWTIDTTQLPRYGAEAR
jgi:Uma2 family endonuclease